MQDRSQQDLLFGAWTAIRGRTDLSALAKIVYLELATAVAQDKSPGLRAVSRAIGFSASGVRRAVSELCTTGLIKRNPAESGVNADLKIVSNKRPPRTSKARAKRTTRRAQNVPPGARKTYHQARAKRTTRRAQNRPLSAPTSDNHNQDIVCTHNTGVTPPRNCLHNYSSGLRKSQIRDARIESAQATRQSSAQEVGLFGDPISPKQPLKREPNPVWDTICDLWGLNPVTKADQKRLGSLTRDYRLKLGDLPVTEIARRRANHLAAWPSVEASPESLLKHWDRFADNGRANASSTPDIAEIIRQAEAMEGVMHDDSD